MAQNCNTMEQIFNFKRFINYARCQLALNKKSGMLKIGGSAVALFLFAIFLLGTRAIRGAEGWHALFLGSGILAILLVVGSAFPSLRKKGEAMQFLTLPASLFEKFVFEFLVKVVLFLALYPLFFYLIGQMAVGFADFVFYKQKVIPFDFHIMQLVRNNEALYLIIWGIVFGVSLFFAGSTAFRKLPQVMTLLFIGLAISLVSGYMYIVVEEMNLGRGIGEFMEHHFKEPELFLPYVYTFLGLSAISALAFAFFKLKEKEV